MSKKDSHDSHKNTALLFIKLGYFIVYQLVPFLPYGSRIPIILIPGYYQLPFVLSQWNPITYLLWKWPTRRIVSNHKKRSV